MRNFSFSISVLFDILSLESKSLDALRIRVVLITVFKGTVVSSAPPCPIYKSTLKSFVWLRMN